MKKEENTPLLFQRKNYLIMITGIGILIIGFLLLSGGGADDPKSFNPEIFSFRRLTLAPLTLLAGFSVVGFAIFHKSKS